MIVGNRIDKVEVPHEPGNYIHLRELSGMELDEAQEIRSNTALKKYASLGKETIETLRDGSANSSNGDIEAARALAMQSNPRLDYDWQYMIDKAVVGWSGPEYDSVELNDENKKLLNKVTRDWVVDEIIKRNVVTDPESLTSEGY